MSARASRRSQSAAAYGLPSVPIAEIRTRKWAKQLKTVGHLTIPKWVPDQEHPTEALQRGAYKKSKGRKRGAGEVGRMTRSVRQHLDAPLELLQEFPVQTRHSSRHSSPARTTASPTPAQTPVPMPSLDAAAPVAASAQAPVAGPVSVATMPAAPVKAEPAVAEPAVQPAVQVMQPALDEPELLPKAETVSAEPTPAIPMIPMMPPVSNQMMTDVPSDEQLEMVLDDLPMLDADDSFNLDALDPAFLPHPPPTHANVPVGGAQPGVPTPSETSQQPSAENSSTSVSEDDASANSGSSMPSMSPQSSPMMSRSPSQE